MTMSEIFSSGRKTTNGQTDGRIQQKSLKLEPRRVTMLVVIGQRLDQQFPPPYKNPYIIM